MLPVLVPLTGKRTGARQCLAPHFKKGGRKECDLKRLEQIGVGSGTMKGNGFGRRVDFINQHPIALNMTIKASFPFAVQGVVFAAERQRLFVNKQAHYIEDFAHIPAPFFRQGKFMFETCSAFDCKHALTPQIRQQFLKGMEGRRGNLTTHHGPAFPNSRGGFGVGRVIQAAFSVHAYILNPPLRSKFLPEDLTLRVGGYFNSLFYGHILNIV